MYLVGTPIGNLADITFRAVETLKSVAVIAAEDTRQSRKLCQRYEISAPLVPLHEHNEASQSARLIERLLNGESAAYVTDAGMPVISDPGARLVRAAREAGVPVAVVPGPSAVPAALALSGFRGERFRFEGFPPKKSAAMVRWLEGLREEGAPVICFESPYRLVKTLTLIRETLGEIPVFVARELTKLHEEGVAGSTGELIRRYTERPPKGEVTLLFQPQP